MAKFQNTGQPDRDWWSALWPDPAGTLRDLGLEAGDSVADVASGNGYFTLPAARITGEPVYAVDIDSDLLGELADRAADAGLDRIETIEGDARALPELLPEPVDVVLFANTLHGVPEPESFLQSAREVLTDSGRLVVVNWHDLPREETTVLEAVRGPPTDLRLCEADCIDLVREAGFDEIRTVDLPPYHYGLVCQ
ncbi:class I SAM-dependent methyltransferase [Haloarchaeobius sp. HME9146]|uniref:class I SAM-dependent methyltransferase n=1 Tax=Haloarchaeobius sp. HME9146 TaxID=2978732 RepID=UPI0021C17BFE|nr:class I SAM-dependent methyltransferase [Haloarchaeobius sp. HME9146]MCT9094822.1 class I SAM-dependent methyltransferase [Haloarchaeobius sp. HME9146]